MDTISADESSLFELLVDVLDDLDNAFLLEEFQAGKPGSRDPRAQTVRTAAEQLRRRQATSSGVMKRKIDRLLKLWKQSQAEQ